MRAATTRPFASREVIGSGLRNSKSQQADLIQTNLMYGDAMAADSVPADSSPAFLQLVGNHVRWRLLRELALSDLRVGELTGRVGQPQNAVSYHLGRLRSGGLVSKRRSSADHRDSYYHFDLPRCGDLFSTTVAALHPGLAAVPVAAVRRHPTGTVRVLFLCTGNSARSQIAEALLRHTASEWVEVASAGSHPKDLHPNAVRALREYGIDIAGQRSKHLSEVTGRHFDYVVTLCDKVREACPQLPGGPLSVHWSIPDPAAEGAGEASYPTFRRVAADLHTRITFFTHHIAHPQPRDGPS